MIVRIMASAANKLVIDGVEFENRATLERWIVHMRMEAELLWPEEEDQTKSKK